MLVFSTCWNGHRHTDGEELVNEILLLGFEAIEVSHGTRLSLFPGLVKAVESGRIAVAGCHNFCPSPVEVMVDAPDAFEFTAEDEAERERAIKLTLKSIDTAAKFDSDYLVLHMGSSSLRRRTRELEALASKGALNNRKFVSKKLDFIEAREAETDQLMERIREALEFLIPYAEEKRISLGVEIRSHYEQAPSERELAALLDLYDSPALGYWHDFGHAQRKENLSLLDHTEVIETFRDRMVGAHFHDCHWPAKDHQAPFSGDANFPELLTNLPDDIPLVWEMSPKVRSADIRQSLEDFRNLS